MKGREEPLKYLLSGGPRAMTHNHARAVCVLWQVTSLPSSIYKKLPFSILLHLFQSKRPMRRSSTILGSPSFTVARVFPGQTKVLLCLLSFLAPAIASSVHPTIHTWSMICHFLYLWGVITST